MKVFIARKRSNSNDSITTHLIVFNRNIYDSYRLSVSKLKKRLSKKYVKYYISIHHNSYISYEFSDDITVDEVCKNYIKDCESYQYQEIMWIQVYEIKL